MQNKMKFFIRITTFLYIFSFHSDLATKKAKLVMFLLHLLRKNKTLSDALNIHTTYLPKLTDSYLQKDQK